MSFASILRKQVETTLSERHSALLTTRLRVPLERMACGVAGIDALLQGGLPVGVITELVGSPCSGRTTAALAYTASFTEAGGVCAWIDVADALDLQSAAASGVALERLLWVRCGPPARPPSAEAVSAPLRDALRSDPAVSAAPGPVAFVSAAPGPNASESAAAPAAMPPPRHTGGGSPHPRSEGLNMPQAITAMLGAHGGLLDRHVRRDKNEKTKTGTPGAPNRPLNFRAEDREEQVNTDRLPPRRGENLTLVSRFAEPVAEPAGGRPPGAYSPPGACSPTPSARAVLRPLPQAATKPWQALDQALRATDLLLQSGGFSTLVLDLGSTPPEYAWRIPLATWFRFRAACERTRVSLLLLTQHPCARSAAELVVRLNPGVFEAHSLVMTGIRYRAEVARNRSAESRPRVVPIRKLPQPERPGEWRSEAAWVRA